MARVLPSWFFILIWLRHIYPPWGWVGLTILSAYLASLSTRLALAAMRWVAPRIKGASRGRRIMGLLALAGWWIVLGLGAGLDAQRFSVVAARRRILGNFPCSSNPRLGRVSGA